MCRVYDWYPMKMKNIVPLVFKPTVLDKIIVVSDSIFMSYMSYCRATAPKLVVYYNERLCNFV